MPNFSVADFTPPSDIQRGKNETGTDEMPRLTDPKQSNPRAMSVRIKSMRLARAWSRWVHDMRRQRTMPAYIDKDRIKLNSVLIPPLLPDDLAIRLAIDREEGQIRTRGRERKSPTSDPVIGYDLILTCGDDAGKWVEGLTREEQDAFFFKLAKDQADFLGVRLTGLVVHRDETTIHAHAQLTAVDCETGAALSNILDLTGTRAMQDRVWHSARAVIPKIERGHDKRDRLAAGATIEDTRNKTVQRLHDEMDALKARKLAEIEAELRTVRTKLEAEVKTLSEQVDDLAGAVAQDEDRLAKAQAKLAEAGGVSEKLEKRVATYERRLAGREAELEAANAALQGALDAKAAAEAEAARIIAPAIAAAEAEAERIKAEAEAAATSETTKLKAAVAATAERVIKQAQAQAAAEVADARSIKSAAASEAARTTERAKAIKRVAEIEAQEITGEAAKIVQQAESKAARVMTQAEVTAAQIVQFAERRAAALDAELKRQVEGLAAERAAFAAEMAARAELVGDVIENRFWWDIEEEKIGLTDDTRHRPRIIRTMTAHPLAGAFATGIAQVIARGMSNALSAFWRLLRPEVRPQISLFIARPDLMTDPQFNAEAVAEMLGGEVEARDRGFER